MTRRKKSKSAFYNCLRCPAYCCSYPRVIVSEKDIARLARYFGISHEQARDKCTKRGEEEGERIFRHQKDEHYGAVCRFLNLETRGCTIYEGRPNICREFPGVGRCGYYDFLAFERRAQEDPDFVSTTWSG